MGNNMDLNQKLSYQTKQGVTLNFTIKDLKGRSNFPKQPTKEKDIEKQFSYWHNNVVLTNEQELRVQKLPIKYKYRLCYKHDQLMIEIKNEKQRQQRILKLFDSTINELSKLVDEQILEQLLLILMTQTENLQIAVEILQMKGLLDILHNNLTGAKLYTVQETFQLIFEVIKNNQIGILLIYSIPYLFTFILNTLNSFQEENPQDIIKALHHLGTDIWQVVLIQKMVENELIKSKFDIIIKQKNQFNEQFLTQLHQQLKQVLLLCQSDYSKKEKQQFKNNQESQKIEELVQTESEEDSPNLKCKQSQQKQCFDNQLTDEKNQQISYMVEEQSQQQDKIMIIQKQQLNQNIEIQTEQYELMEKETNVSQIEFIEQSQQTQQLQLSNLNLTNFLNIFFQISTDIIDKNLSKGELEGMIQYLLLILIDDLQIFNQQQKQDQQFNIDISGYMQLLSQHKLKYKLIQEQQDIEIQTEQPIISLQKDKQLKFIQTEAIQLVDISIQSQLRKKSTAQQAIQQNQLASNYANNRLTDIIKQIHQISQVQLVQVEQDLQQIDNSIQKSKNAQETQTVAKPFQIAQLDQIDFKPQLIHYAQMETQTDFEEETQQKEQSDQHLQTDQINGKDQYQQCECLFELKDECQQCDFISQQDKENQTDQSDQHAVIQNSIINAPLQQSVQPEQQQKKQEQIQKEDQSQSTLPMAPQTPNSNSFAPPPPPPMPPKLNGAPPPPKMNGAPPPPPSQLLNQPTQKIIPSVSMKPLNWVVVKESKNSIFENMELNYDELNITYLEEQFQKVIVESKTSRQTLPPVQSQKTQLLPAERSKTIELVLGKIRIPSPLLARALLEIDLNVLKSSVVESLIVICPNEDDIKHILEYSGQKENLGTAEQYVDDIRQVPGYQYRMKSLQFINQFPELKNDLADRVNQLSSAFQELIKLDELKTLFEQCLTVGNFMNAQTYRGNAKGFKIDVIEKCSEVKNRDNQSTLLHYIIDISQKKLKKELITDEQILKVQAIQKYPLSQVQQDFQEISVGMQQIQRAIESQSDDKLDQVSCKLEEKQQQMDQDIQQIDESLKQLNQNGKNCLIYFCEDPKESTEVFGQKVIKMFKLLIKAIKEIKEQEKKKQIQEKKQMNSSLNLDQQKQAQSQTARPGGQASLINELAMKLSRRNIQSQASSEK